MNLMCLMQPVTIICDAHLSDHLMMNAYNLIPAIHDFQSIHSTNKGVLVSSLLASWGLQGIADFLWEGSHLSHNL